MNTATILLRERLRTFFSRFSFTAKEKYDLFRHHSRVTHHHDLHKSPLSQTIHGELEAEKELIIDFFSSIVQSIGHHISRILETLAPHMPMASTSNEKNGLTPFRSKTSIVRRPYWRRARPLLLPRPSLPPPHAPIILDSPKKLSTDNILPIPPPPKGLPLRDQR